MSELENRILNTFARVIPKLSKRGQENILSFGEGLAVGAGVMKLEESSLFGEKEESETDKAANLMTV